MIAAWFHRARADRGTTADQVAGHQRLVLGNHRNDLLRAVDHIADRIVLAAFAVLNRKNVQSRGIDIGIDTGPDRGKAVEALAAGPLLEGLVFEQKFDRGDVVDAGISEYVRVGLLRSDCAAFLADDDTQLRLEDDAALVTAGAVNCCIGSDHAGYRFHEIERGCRDGLAFGCGALMEVIPQGQDRIRFQGRE